MLNSKSMEFVRRFTGKANSSNLFEAIKSLLNEFGLDTVDLSAMTTDGASVMANVASLMEIESTRKKPFHHQKCLAHALHLAVEDILLPKKKKTIVMETTEVDGEKGTAINKPEIFFYDSTSLLSSSVSTSIDPVIDSNVDTDNDDDDDDDHDDDDNDDNIVERDVDNDSDNVVRGNTMTMYPGTVFSLNPFL